MEEYDFDHKIVEVNGINMHVVEKGQGPFVLFIHGFPELWYSWRHQISFMAKHGYRAVAPDLRGYGDTTDDPSKFSSLRVVGDLVELLNTIVPEEDKVFVVGHDWGAIIAWNLCLLRPDKVKALVNMSVPFSPRNPKRKPIESLKAIYGDDYYIVRFQEPGVMEAEFAKTGTKKVLEKFLTFRNPGPLYLPKGKHFDDNPVILPSWLSQKEVDYFASKCEQTGFTGGFNYYRALDLNWELTAAWSGAKVKVPVKFIVGDLDLTYNSPGAKDYINKGEMKKNVPLLEKVVILENVGHFLQQEKPDEINKHIHDFFKGFSST
ncbi:hypothetical protein AABB24_019659 [Solanum stoloniferum]|uniref:soluble epoxide hydrolase n=1 Tax=Solanum stoloniferum TaxID=62892 RepID=A0ABD2T5Q2_9SOLN